MMKQREKDVKTKIGKTEMSLTPLALDISEDLRTLPELQGYGNVANEASYNHFFERKAA